MPKVKDEAKGFTKTFWRTAPFRARIPPTARAAMSLGSLKWTIR
jgi:hypothetical protein